MCCEPKEISIQKIKSKWHLIKPIIFVICLQTHWNCNHSNHFQSAAVVDPLTLKRSHLTTTFHWTCQKHPGIPTKPLHQLKSFQQLLGFGLACEIRCQVEEEWFLDWFGRFLVGLLWHHELIFQASTQQNASSKHLFHHFCCVCFFHLLHGSLGMLPAFLPRWCRWCGCLLVLGSWHWSILVLSRVIWTWQ